MRRLLLLILSTVAIPALLSENAQGQSTIVPEEAQTGVVLSNLSAPIYPGIARTARITGDVELKLRIRGDGSIESADAISGPEMLKQAALDSAQHSQFECRECSDQTFTYSLIYSFRIEEGSRTPAKYDDTHAEVVQSQHRVTITTEPALVHIQFAYLRARSPRCLYLWNCGTHWSGEDYYFYRVRSPKCLYLWNCGIHRRDDPHTVSAQQR